MADVFRTPDERFVALPGWDLEPRYVEWDGLRLAWHEAGPSDADETVVLIHGEPTWGYLYRKYVGPLTNAGLRVILPDNVGFGRSDKPTDRDWYSYERLVGALDATLDAALLPDPFTLVVHDWGGPVGLRWASEHEDRVARIVMHDTGLYRSGAKMSDAFHQWQEFVRHAEDLPVGPIIMGATVSALDPDVVRAYEAPFPTRESHAASLALPLMVPTDEDHPNAAPMEAVHDWLLRWERPFLALWGADDAVIPPSVGEGYAAAVPGSHGCEVFPDANHFLQEDAGELLAPRIVRFIAAT